MWVEFVVGVEEGSSCLGRGSVALEGARGSWFQGFTTGSASLSPWRTAERAPEEQPQLPGAGVLLRGPSERLVATAYASAAEGSPGPNKVT